MRRLVGPIDGYWAMYPQHKTKAVLEILMQCVLGHNFSKDVDPCAHLDCSLFRCCARYKIGKLDAADVKQVDENDPYANDPERSQILKPHTTAPFNSETVSRLIPDHYLTPNDIWYRQRFVCRRPTCQQHAFPYKHTHILLLHLGTSAIITLFPTLSPRNSSCKWRATTARRLSFPSMT